MRKNNNTLGTILSSFSLIFLISGAARAQAPRFTRSGTVEYEKTVNMYALIKKTINKSNELLRQPLFDQYKAAQPQMKVSKAVLIFDNSKSLFTPVVGDEKNTLGFARESMLAEQANIVYTNYSARIRVSQKMIFGDTYLLTDSVSKTKWKLTSETRDIAGYRCRRANAVIMDSIYVVAFYAEGIPVPGGPESFSGLPGMILGIALPHENITWFATRVYDMPVQGNAIVPPAKGKNVDRKGLLQTLQAQLKDWKEYANAYLKSFLF